MNGILYIVSTPIGNLEDISLRAIRILKEVDFILCEDTRVTSILLNKFEISKELISFNAQSEVKKIEYVISRLKTQNCALVSDAGTPCLSDPGTRLTTACIKENIKIESIPGASALLTALTLSGFPADAFVFEGFLPQKKGRQKKLSELSNELRTIVFYESVYRIEKLLNELNEYMPDRYIVLCRELTKKFEEVRRGLPRDILYSFSDMTLKGEFVIVISPLNWTIK